LNVARDPAELRRDQRAVALGSFDGVHVGHRRVLDAVREAGRPATVVTFWPHPRLVLGQRIELLSTLQRRLELFEAAGMDEALVLEFTPELANLEPAAFADAVLRRIGTRVIAVGENFRFGRGAAGDAELLDELGFDVRSVPLADRVSSTEVRERVRTGDVEGAAKLLGRPPELEGQVVRGEGRGATLGFPTANLAVPPELLVPSHGIYAGAALGRRAAVSIGVNPHYGGVARRVEAHMLDFAGDLYGQRLVIELWRRLRDERAFASEDELVRQIARDVEQARSAARPGS
jgi:riboflavin kinase / FMN adenylyltransferase